MENKEDTGAIWCRHNNVNKKQCKNCNTVSDLKAKYCIECGNFIKGNPFKLNK